MKFDSNIEALSCTGKREECTAWYADFSSWLRSPAGGSDGRPQRLASALGIDAHEQSRRESQLNTTLVTRRIIEICFCQLILTCIRLPKNIVNQIVCRQRSLSVSHRITAISHPRSLGIKLSLVEPKYNQTFKHNTAQPFVYSWYSASGTGTAAKDVQGLINESSCERDSRR